MGEGGREEEKEGKERSGRGRGGEKGSGERRGTIVVVVTQARM